MSSSAEIRQTFLDYFAAKGHKIVSSSSLVPGNDPTLLFTNAGMVQFKDTFLGQDPRPYHRATTVQRCVRAGGKHNDLENVGYTARHHTFFEMLGNFSFGDYFKRDAILFAWEFLTEVCQLPAERLWITVYADDDEASAIWLEELGVDAARFTRIGDKPGGRTYESDNFWAMGDTGPCGPCSEIFYDHGAEIAGGPPGTPEEDGDRFIEIWNLVFMQYERDDTGTLNPLPKPSVDTGLGLERLVAVLQGVHSNYQIDLFQGLIKSVAELASCADMDNDSLKVIADHIRACAFLVVDGVVPANEGRGYVLRRIIRRAIRHGHKLGMPTPFFHTLVGPLVAQMGAAYPELQSAQQLVDRVLRQEEERFAETLEQGMSHLESAIAELAGDQIPGEVLFKLYDTYGFPVDLTADVARERSLNVDLEGFETAMERQRERARAASQFDGGGSGSVDLDVKTDFVGYDGLSGRSQVVALIRDGERVERLEGGEEGAVVLDQTPFYAESGGQIGDGGEINTSAYRFTVTDTRKQGSASLHIGRVDEGGALVVGEQVTATVAPLRRRDIAYNHSATHLLHAALRQHLGDHVEQKGSMVSADRLRFDFSHFEGVTTEQLREIEETVNDKIRENLPVVTKIMGFDEAKGAGAMALFGEKYGAKVRVLSMGDFSVELCGGTHVDRSGDIGLLHIVSESGIAAGVRRIEALTGQRALQALNEDADLIHSLSALLKGSRDALPQRVEGLLEQSRQLEKELERLKGKMASNQGADLASQAEEIDGISIVAAKLEGADPKMLREAVDQLKDKLGCSVVLLAAVQDAKVSLVAGVSRDATVRIKAGELMKWIAPQVGGKGGGRPDMAQGGGSRPEALDEALKLVPEWIRQQLQQ